MSRTATARAATKAAPKSAPKPVTAAAQRKADESGAATSTYTVGDCPIQHDGVLYLPGHEIGLTPEQAERLGSRVAGAPGQTTNQE